MALASATPTGSYSASPLIVAAPNPDPPQILSLQSPPSAPQSDVLVTGTSLLNITPSTITRMRNFPEEVYSLNPTDNLVKLVKVLLGEAGAGQLKKRMTMARLGSVIQGTNFYDLDSFYGSVFGISRNSSEVLPINPYTDLADADTWSSIRSQDASYRSRIDQFAKAVGFGPSATGMRMVAEAILQTPCSIFEWWNEVDGGFASGNRNLWIITPQSAISELDAFNLRQVLNVLKPANTFFWVNTGGNAFSELTVRGVAADSSYWEVVESVIPNPQYVDLYNLSSTVQPGGWQEVLRAAFTEYRGEQISYGGDVAGVTSSELDGSGNILGSEVIGSYTFADGTILYYPPSQAIANRFFAASSRFVSDGIMQSAPYSASPGNVSASAIASVTGINSISDTPPCAVYVDGFSLAEISDAVQRQNLPNPIGGENPSERYWCTSTRLSTDDTQEVLTVSLTADRLVNSISFEVAHYPQSIEVQGYSVENGWSTIYTQNIYDSVPAVLTNIVPSVHQNPQHSTQGNWQTINLIVDPIVVSQIQITLQRISNGTPPVSDVLSTVPNTSGTYSIISTPVPYSLAVRNFAVGYQIAQESDIPEQPIVTQDVLGSQAQFTVRYEEANNALSDSGSPWRCEPQPIAEAVVNFYADVRTGTGLPQVVDRIFLDPTYIGPHCTLYYSNDNVSSLGFEPGSAPLAPPVCVGVGSVNPNGNGLSFDSLAASYVDIDNTKILFDPSEAWFCGTALIPAFNSSDGNGQVLWDFGNGLLVKFESNSVVLTANSLSATISNVKFIAGQQIYVSVAYFPESTEAFAAGLYLFFNNGTQVSTQPNALAFSPLVSPDISPIFDTRYLVGGNSASTVNGSGVPTLPAMGEVQGQLRIGGAQTSPVAANFQLVGFSLIQPELKSDDQFLFAQDSTSYTTLNGSNTQNALLRFDPSLVNSESPLGFIGGPGNFWRQLSWTSVLQDFVCQKGYMQFAPIYASFLKLEFTNLIAQPIASVVPITQTVQTFQGMGESIVQANPPASYGNPGAALTGTSLNASLSNSINFNDSVVLNTTPNQPNAPTATQPTQIQYSPDLPTQMSLANSAWYWQYQTWSSHSDAPRFVQTGVHQYQTYTVTQDSQIGYFVGLNSFSVYRTNPAEGVNIQIYDETFCDDEYMSVTNINQDPGDVNTVGITDVTSPVPTAQSSTYVSSVEMSGLRFATIQSDAVQIAFDDNFENNKLGTPSYGWNQINDAHLIGDAILNYLPTTSSVLVTRNNAEATPPTLYGEAPDGIVDDIVHPIMDEVFSPPSSNPSMTSTLGIYDSQPGGLSYVLVPGYLASTDAEDLGGIANAVTPTSKQGVIYGAVRLTTNQTLASPLYLQLVDYATGTVLASKEIVCAPGQIIEDYVPYSLGSIAGITAGNPVFTQVIQYGYASNSWTVQRLSTFDAGWNWEFSIDGGSTWVNAFDVRNQTYGVISFPSPGNQLVWKVTGNKEGLHLNHLRIRPIYVTSSQNEPLGVVQGPNLSVWDYLPPIESDPYFSSSFSPIPSWWYVTGQEYPILGTVNNPVPNQYSSFYVRSESENFAIVSDTATRQEVLRRTTYEAVPMGTDSSGREEVLHRAENESIALGSDTAVATVIASFPKGIVAPPVEDVP